MGVGWFSTVQDIPSLHFMLQFDVSTFKIASSNARNRPLLEECARVIPTTKELVISVAGSTPQQIEEALAIFPSHKIWLLHCVAQYPCPVDKLRLGNIGEMRRRFASDRVRIGYSGHEEGVTPSLAAVAMGAEMVERHFCLSRHSFVHHIECSLEPDEFRLMVDSATSPEKIEAARASLPATAFENHFGMTEREKSFLVEQTYGNRYLHEGSELPAPPRTGGVGKAA
jgi:N-acetylneuraminate synthase